MKAGSSIEAFGDELEKLGGVIGDDTAKAAAEFNDNILKIQKNIDALTQRIGNSLIPSWNEWLELVNNPSTFNRLDIDSGTIIESVNRINEQIVSLKVLMIMHWKVI